MKLLFDTHTFIWWDSEPARLSPKVLALLSNKSNVKLLSVASIWEIQIKHQLGKLSFKIPPFWRKLYHLAETKYHL